MPPFKAVLSEREIDAMATYIETEFKAKPPEEEQPVIEAPRRSMEVVYVMCAGCHKKDGSGGPGYGGYAASFRETTLDHEQLVAVITDGTRERGMPPFEGVLSDRVIDAMATYIETEFKGKPVVDK
jgi:mono/diheme cytochrome c family protein